MRHREQTSTAQRRRTRRPNPSARGFRLLFSHHPLPMWVYDLATLRFLDVNNAAVRRYGYTRDEFLAMRITDIRPPEDIPRLLANISRPRAAFEEAGVWRHRLKSGEIADVQITSHALTFNGRAAVLVMAQDVTERLRSERALRRSEARKAAILDSALDCIITIDGEGRIVEFNPAAERTFGHARGDVIGRPLADVIIPPDLRQAHRDGLARFLATGDQVVIGRRLEMRAMRADGSEFPVELAISAIPEEDGTLFTGFVRDISDRKQAEEEVRRLNLELEQRVLDRTIQLEAANKELEAFSYSVSHDLRAPLRAIDGFSRILLEEHAPSLPPEGQRYLRVVRESVCRMGELIDDLLLFSRLSRQPLKVTRVDPADLVRRALEDLAAEQEGRRVEVRIGSLPECEADPALLTQVFVNLLSNALKFTRKRPVAVIEVGAFEETGTDGARSSGSSAGGPAGRRAPTYYVRDNGAGFDMRYREKLFKVFQRLHRAEEYEGTGVGLAIVHRIIGRHGGRVWAEAEPDKGATFYFVLGERNAHAANGAR